MHESVAITTDAAAAKYVMGRTKTTWSRESMTRWFECVINYFLALNVTTATITKLCHIQIYTITNTASKTITII